MLQNEAIIRPHLHVSLNNFVTKSYKCVIDWSVMILKATNGVNHQQ